MEYITGGTLMV